MHVPFYVSIARCSESVTSVHLGAPASTHLHVHVVCSGLAVHVASKDVGALTGALAALLDARHAVRSPVLADKGARLLLTMLAPQLSVTKRALTAPGGRGALAPDMQRPGALLGRWPHGGRMGLLD
jgi:hypothetical protein